jgi:hypothetical protein
MASQAAVEDLAGGLFGEGEDFGLIAAALDMGFTGSVTALATGRLAFVMGIAEEVAQDVGVARAAGVTADEGICDGSNAFRKRSSFRWLSPSNWQAEKD